MTEGAGEIRRGGCGEGARSYEGDIALRSKRRWQPSRSEKSTKVAAVVDRHQKQIGAAGVIQLIRADLNSGIMMRSDEPEIPRLS